MALPKIATPQYTLKLPSTGKQIKYRPCLVKEEKILLMAMESEDEQETINCIKKIISDCTDIKQSIDELPTFDIEYLFPGRYGDTLLVETHIEKKEGIRIIFINSIKKKNEDRLLAKSKTTLICINNDFKPVKIPETVREKL